ncbi:MAG: Lrp/AsnC family transcriptional regulator [Paludibacteraceae bacterium]|nr:Lrp/AsnC family transcriptional regulator [Paludibacteraceae bacterium]
MNLDQLDLKILSILSENAKTPFLEIARICNVSGAAIHQHIQHLTNIGVIKGSVFLLEPSLIGYNTCAFISVNLQPDADMEGIAEELKKIPEIVECHITSGKSSLLLKVYTTDNASLLELLSSKINSVSGIVSTDITISLKEGFARQIRL